MSDEPPPIDDGYFAGRPTASSEPRQSPPSPAPTSSAVPLVVVAVGILLAAVLGGTAGLVVLGQDQPPARAAAGVAGSVDTPPPGPYEGPGTFRTWVTNDDGSAVRWDPCTTIAWVLNPAGAPVSALADVQVAFERVAQATGLTFTYEGTTDEVPGRERAPYAPDRWDDRWAPVLVAWAPPGTGDLDLTDGDRAVTVPVSVDVGDGGVFVTGQVVFNAERVLQGGFVTRQSHWGGTILHELGHLVGLDHVDDDGELMYPRPGLGPATWGPGDLAGLGRLGAAMGCLAVPTPQHVEVDYAPAA